MGACLQSCNPANGLLAIIPLPSCWHATVREHVSNAIAISGALPSAPARGSSPNSTSISVNTPDDVCRFKQEATAGNGSDCDQSDADGEEPANSCGSCCSASSTAAAAVAEDQRPHADSRSSKGDNVQCSAACLLVRGFQEEGDTRLNGLYVEVDGLQHHGRPIYRWTRPEASQGELSSQQRGVQGPSFYFWDERDGFHNSGWWLGSKVGGGAVNLAFCPGVAEVPPAAGWRQPWYANVLSDARVLRADASGEPLTAEPEADATITKEVEAPNVSVALRGVISAFQETPALHLCADCRQPMRVPCALPCGHLVCLEHLRPSQAASEGEPGITDEASIVQQNEVYQCPHSPECRLYPQTGGCGPFGWRPSGVAQQLLSLLDHDLCIRAPQVKSLKASAFWQATGGNAMGGADGAAKGVLASDTPLRLIAAYEWLGHECGLAGRDSDAAAACAAAQHVHEAFLGEPAENLSAAVVQGVRGKEVRRICARPDLVANSVGWQYAARSKACALAKRCGNHKALSRALVDLPVPQVDGLGTHAAAVDFVSLLRPYNAQARQALDCPICYRLLLEPTTTPCGHTFCRDCLARVLDAISCCPLCRGPLCGSINAYAPCSALQNVIEKLWPEEFAHREEARSTELREAHVHDAEWLPLYAPGAFVVPQQRCTLHCVEPRLRFMVRRALESGRRRLAMCAPVEGDGGVTSGSFGTELEVQQVRVAPDGRTMLYCIGLRSFRVIDKLAMDGCEMVHIEFSEQEDVHDSEARQATEELFKQVRRLRQVARTLFAMPYAAHNDASPSEDGFPDVGDTSACDAMAWEVLATLPVPVAGKCRCLGGCSRAERLRTIANTVEDFLWSELRRSMRIERVIV